jgi:5-methylcytosine-specific restriction endonuclease McrA
MCHKHYQAASKAKDPEAHRRRDRARYQRDKAKRRAAVRAREQREPEKVKAERKSYYDRNRPKITAFIREWSRANHDKILAYAAKRKALLLGTPGEFSTEEWADRKAEYGWLCGCCGLPKKLSVDHIVPLSWGGTNWIWNIQPLCKSCNSAKKNYHATYYPPKVI